LRFNHRPHFRHLTKNQFEKAVNSQQQNVSAKTVSRCKVLDSFLQHSIAGNILSAPLKHTFNNKFNPYKFNAAYTKTVGVMCLVGSRNFFKGQQTLGYIVFIVGYDNWQRD